MYIHMGIIGRDKTIQLSLALFVIVSDSVTLGERAYNSKRGVTALKGNYITIRQTTVPFYC